MNDLIFAKCEKFPGPGMLALPVGLLPLFPLSFSFSDFLLYHSPVIFLRNLLVYVNHSFFSRKFILFFFLSVCVSMYLNVHTRTSVCSQKPEEDIGFPGELLNMDAETTLRPLQEQYAPVTDEPSLQAPKP